MERAKFNSKIYEAAGLQHEKISFEIQESLKIVADFIKKKKRIVVGGFAIDVLLREKGTQLYPDELSAFPDLDFLSSNNVNDSQELADILYEAGMPNVSAVGALHVQTRRVRIDNRVVADITYIPPNVFEKIPFIEINGMRIIHPLYQRADQHMASSKLFVDGPREVVFNRLKKDVERFNLIDKYYPLELEYPSITLKKYTIPKNIYPIYEPLNLSTTIHGYAAYALLITHASELKPEILKDPKIIKASFILDDTITYEAPFPELQLLIEMDEEKIKEIKEIKEMDEYEPLIDIKPPIFKKHNIELWNFNGILISAGSCTNIIIPSIQYILLFLLGEYFYAAEERKDVHLAMYMSLLKALSYLDYSSDCSPFFIPTSVIGKNNMSESQEIKVMRIKEGIGIKEECLGQIPPNYWPATSMKIENFAYRDCKFFRKSGEKIERKK